MTLDGYLHKHLLENDDWYNSMSSAGQEDYRRGYKKTLVGLRVFAEYCMDKYIRRTIK